MRSGNSFYLAIFSLLTAFVFLCAPGSISTRFDNAAYAEMAETFSADDTAVVTVNDPYEKFNRSMFNFNDKLYFYVIRPAGTVYAAYLPPGVRAAVRNGFYNLLFPARAINSLLQGKPEKAGTETARFVINSTMGLAGLFDYAETGFGIHPHDEDFGQTLAVWGSGSGPYLVLPILGPSNPRDFAGYVVDSAMDPLYWIPSPIWVSPTVKAGKLVNNASLRMREYEDFKKAALDPYVSLRSAYQQYRQREISK